MRTSFAIAATSLLDPVVERMATLPQVVGDSVAAHPWWPATAILATVAALALTTAVRADARRRAPAVPTGTFRGVAAVPPALWSSPGTAETAFIPVVVADLAMPEPDDEDDGNWWETGDPDEEATDEVLAADVAEHVAPGVGSVVSLAEVDFDTKTCRTPSEQAHLDGVWNEAHAEQERRREIEFWAGFEAAMDRAVDEFRRTDRRIHRLHVASDTHCPHCREVLEQHSGEFAQLVRDRERTDTREIDRRAVAALLAD